MSGTNPALEYFHARLLDTIAHLHTVSATTPLVTKLSFSTAKRSARTIKSTPPAP